MELYNNHFIVGLELNDVDLEFYEIDDDYQQELENYNELARRLKLEDMNID